MAGLMLPGGLADLLNEMGYIWPKSDEVKIFELGQHWMGFGTTLQGIHGEAQPHAQHVTTHNLGEAIDAFKQRWDAEDAGAALVRDGATGSMVVGACLFVAAGLVLALKINVIVQLTILVIEIAQAIATAAVTFGASLAEIPVFKKLADIAINLILSQVIEALLA
jgi:hypothetical protein